MFHVKHCLRRKLDIDFGYDRVVHTDNTLLIVKIKSNKFYQIILFSYSQTGQKGVDLEMVKIPTSAGNGALL